MNITWSGCMNHKLKPFIAQLFFERRSHTGILPMPSGQPASGKTRPPCAWLTCQGLQSVALCGCCYDTVFCYDSVFRYDTVFLAW